MTRSSHDGTNDDETSIYTSSISSLHSPGIRCRAGRKMRQNNKLQPVDNQIESARPSFLWRGSGKKRTRQPNLSKEKVSLMESAREVFDKDPRAYLDIVEKRYTEKYGYNHSFYAVPEEGKDYTPPGIETFPEGTEREAEKKRRAVFTKELRNRQLKWARQKWKYTIRPGSKRKAVDETMEQGDAGTIIEADQAVNEEVQLATNRADILSEHVKLWAQEDWIAQTEARRKQLHLGGGSGSTYDQRSARGFDSTSETFLQSFADTLASMTGDVITIVASGPRPDGTFGVKSLTTLPPVLRSSNPGTVDVSSSTEPQNTRELNSTYVKHACTCLKDDRTLPTPVLHDSATPFSVLHDETRTESESVMPTSTPQLTASASSTGVSSTFHQPYLSSHVPLPLVSPVPINGISEPSSNRPIVTAPETPESNRSPSSSTRVRRKRRSEEDALNAEAAQFLPTMKKRPRLDVTPVKGLKESGSVPVVRKRRTKTKDTPREDVKKVEGDTSKVFECVSEVYEQGDKIPGKEELVTVMMEKKEKWLDFDVGRCLLM